jgi:hypothetical protein
MESNYSEFYDIVRANWTPDQMFDLGESARPMSNSVVERVNQYGMNPFWDVPENSDIDTDWDFPEPPAGIR